MFAPGKAILLVSATNRELEWGQNNAHAQQLQYNTNFIVNPPWALFRDKY